jgi:hypothetical protein
MMENQGKKKKKVLASSIPHTRVGVLQWLRILPDVSVRRVSSLSTVSSSLPAVRWR